MKFGLTRGGRAACAGRGLRPAFTLIELMIVVAIMAIVMTLSIPLLWKATHRDPLNKAVRDMVEVLSQARAMAILQGKMMELVFHPKEGRCEVVGMPGARPRNPETGETEPPPETSGLSAQLSDRLAIEMLDVNLIEYKDAELARVRFYPNGTSDEFTLILHSDKGEWIKIWLEITTAMADVGPVNR